MGGYMMHPWVRRHSRNSRIHFLGVHSEKDLCGHCGLDFFACPGHFGHIEFSKPVFNPLFFDLLFKVSVAFPLIVFASS
ncbi:DNA-directed RNA polymerase I subunit RPA1 [Clonorchis sinensis]|uniref:DNA-directed RNA polymerase n=1 Tax=Clonorchis sinensis TaxID=79923 RepID=G7YRW1_CLOSI|nr:DNA-directed RNA polymerase I subunit RPA1 [Clonorchis sinensis]